MHLTFSGGGFRATLFHLGVVKYLKDRGVLQRVTHIFSVSGGSILAAHLVLNWRKYTSSNDADFAESANKVIEFTRYDVRGRITRRCLLVWSIVITLLVVPPSVLVHFQLVESQRLRLILWAGWVGCMAVVMSYRKRWRLIAFLQRAYMGLYGRSRLSDFATVGSPKLGITCTDLTTGCLAWFTHEGLSIGAPKSSVQLFPNDRLPVSLAVAASSAYPALFSPVEVNHRTLRLESKDMPFSHYLTDGGIIDNLGACAAESLTYPVPQALIVSDAERTFDWHVNEVFSFLVTRAARSTDIMMKRISGLESERIRFAAAIEPSASVSGVDSRAACALDALAETAPGGIRMIRLQDDLEDDSILSRAIHRMAKNVRTDLDAFLPLEVQLLYFSGYLAAHRALSGDIKELERFVRNVHGTPVEANEGAWLPFRSDCDGINLDPERALRRSGQRAIRLFDPRDWISWLQIVCLLTLMLLSYPGLLAQRKVWSLFPVVPRIVLQTDLLQTDRVGPGFDWLLPYMAVMSDDSAQAGTYVWILARSGTFARVTRGRPIVGIIGEIIVQPQDLQITKCWSFLVRDESRDATRPQTQSHLRCRVQADENKVEFVIPPSPGDEELIVAMRLEGDPDAVARFEKADDSVHGASVLTIRRTFVFDREGRVSWK